MPSGVKALPPTFWAVLNTAVVWKPALALFIWEITASVAVSYMARPAMKRDPSGDIESTLDCPDAVRLRRITPEAAS